MGTSIKKRDTFGVMLVVSLVLPCWRVAGHLILFAVEPFFGIIRATTRPLFNSILFNGVF